MINLVKPEKEPRTRFWGGRFRPFPSLLGIETCYIVVEVEIEAKHYVKQGANHVEEWIPAQGKEAVGDTVLFRATDSQPVAGVAYHWDWDCFANTSGDDDHDGVDSLWDDSTSTFVQGNHTFSLPYVFTPGIWTRLAPFRVWAMSAEGGGEYIERFGMIMLHEALCTTDDSWTFHDPGAEAGRVDPPIDTAPPDVERPAGRLARSGC